MWVVAATHITFPPPPLLFRSFSDPTPSPAKRCKTLAFFHRRTDSYLGTVRPAGWMTIPVGWMTVRAKVGTWNGVAFCSRTSRHGREDIVNLYIRFHSWFISFPFLVGRKLQCQTAAEGWCAAGNLGASRVSIRMDDRTDGQRTDDGTHGFRGGFISHPDVL